MKVCLVIDNIDDSYGDSSIYVRNLIKQLYESNILLTVISRNSFNYLKEFEKIRLIKFRTNDINSYRALICEKIRDMQKHGDIDLIITQSKDALTLLFEKYRRIPLIINLVELSTFNQNYNNLINQDKILFRAEKKMLEKCDKIITYSSSFHELVSNKLNVEKATKILPLPLIENKKKKIRKKKKDILFLGSLEEKSGVLIFSTIIDKLEETLGGINIIFIGKDTNNNSQNESTKSLIKHIVSKEYHKFLKFKDINKYDDIRKLAEKSVIGIDSSNIPCNIYNITTSLLSGLPIITTKDSYFLKTNFLYNNHDTSNLYTTILNLYTDKNLLNENSKINYQLISDYCDNSSDFIENYIDECHNILSEYNENLIINTFEENTKIKIKDITRITNDTRNFIYKVDTAKKSYIAKIYKKMIKEDTITEYSKILKKNGYNSIAFKNNLIFKTKNNIICIYDYIEGKTLKNPSNEQIEKIINFVNLEKNTDVHIDSMIDNTNFYYNSLKTMKSKKIRRDFINEILRKYNKLKNYNILSENDLIHGDLNYSNILWNNDNEFTILDLDEIVIFTKLYDIISYTISISKTKDNINIRSARRVLKYCDNYSKIDIITVWNFYLLRKLMKKIYLYETDKIDLKKEALNGNNWEDYYKFLNEGIIEKIINK